MLFIAVLAIILFIKAEATSTSWEKCVTGTGFLVPDKRRCIDFPRPSREKAKQAHSVCKGKGGGHAFHLFTSLEHQLFFEWLETKPGANTQADRRAWIALQRDATGGMDPRNLFWTSGIDEKLDDLTLRELYDPMQWDANPFASDFNKSRCAIIGVCKSGCIANETQYYGHVTWSEKCEINITTDYPLPGVSGNGFRVICEWLSPTIEHIPATFKAHQGKRLGVPAIRALELVPEVASDLVCARRCWEQAHYCQGFNIFRPGNGSNSCELLGKRLEDANATLDMEPTAEYFQLLN